MNLYFLDMILYDSDSDDELEIVTIASMEAESSSKSRHAARHQRLFRNYFADPPVYPPKLFQRRFRMNHSLFLHIQSKVKAYEAYFVHKRNGAGVLGLSSLQKITAALRMLAYGVATDFMDEYLRIGESTAMKSLKKFVKVVVAIFPDEYLRSPNNDNIARLLAVGKSHDFPGMLGSIDCMHWTLEELPSCMERYNSLSTRKKNKHFAEAQEAYRNDVERAFGVLQARFAIVRGLARRWDLQTLKDIMNACIILHNMIIKDERDAKGEQNIDYEQIDKIPHAQVSLEHTLDIMEFIQQHYCIRDRETHSQLQSDLVEHLWQIYSQS
ncbi:hypothetical protein ACSBR1_025929 [Camellia fascicularis]